MRFITAVAFFDNRIMKLYYHKTDGGAEYLLDTFLKCPNGRKEGTINDSTKYVVRIDGNIEKDVELTVRKEECPHLAMKLTIESSVKELEVAKENVRWLLEHPDSLVDMHGIEYWAGRIERLRELIKNSL